MKNLLMVRQQSLKFLSWLVHVRQQWLAVVWWQEPLYVVKLYTKFWGIKAPYLKVRFVDMCGMWNVIYGDVSGAVLTFSTWTVHFRSFSLYQLKHILWSSFQGHKPFGGYFFNFLWILASMLIPLTFVLPITAHDEPWPLFDFWRLTLTLITFDQNWLLLCSTSKGGKDLSNDTQIRVIGWMEPEICTKMLRNYAFSEVFEWEASPVEDQSLQQKDKKSRKRKGKMKIKKKWKA